jgi:hypothetical protein
MPDRPNPAAEIGRPPCGTPPTGQLEGPALLCHYLPAIERVFRDLHLGAGGQTIHWVGRQDVSSSRGHWPVSASGPGSPRNTRPATCTLCPTTLTPWKRTVRPPPEQVCIVPP